MQSTNSHRFSVQNLAATLRTAQKNTSIFRPNLFCPLRLLAPHFGLLRPLFHAYQKITPTTQVVLVLDEDAPVPNKALRLILWVSVFFLHHSALLRGRDRNLQHHHDVFHFTQKLNKENDYVLTGKLWKCLS